MRRLSPARTGARQTHRHTRFGMLASAGTAAYLVVLLVAEQAGLPNVYANVLTGLILVAIFAVPGFFAATTRLGDWLNAGRSSSPTVLGMSMAASALAAGFMIGVSGAFFAGSPSAIAYVAGPACGLAIGSLLIGPHLGKAGTGSIGGYFQARLASRAARATAMALVAVIALLMLWTQLQVAGSLAAIYFPISREAAIMVAAALAVATVAPGGMNGLVRTNSLAFAFIATGILAPLVWLAATTAWFPVPQIAYGPGAVADTLALERQIASLGLRPLSEAAADVLPAAPDAIGAMALMLFLALGFAAFPPLLLQYESAPGIRVARAVAGRAILYVAIVATAAPAAAAFAKLGIYNSIFGLTSGEIGRAASWLLVWGSAAAPLAPDEVLVRLCGQGVATAAQAVAACGGNPDYALGPADLALRGELAALAYPQIAKLPAVFVVVLGAAMAAASIATANACAYAFANAFSQDGHYGLAARNASALGRLFIARLAAASGTATAAWLAIDFGARPLEPALFALALSAACLLPALLLAVFLDSARGAAAAAGMATGALVIAAHHVLERLGPDLLAASGDEIALRLPGLEALPGMVSAALPALCVTAALIVALSLALKGRSEPQTLEALRSPDRSHPTGDPAL